MLAECGQVEAEVRVGKVGVRYVKDGEEGWTPVVTRKTECQKLVVLVVVIWTWLERNGSESLEYIHGRNPRVRQWFVVKPSLFLQGLELN